MLGPGDWAQTFPKVYQMRQTAGEFVDGGLSGAGEVCESCFAGESLIGVSHILPALDLSAKAPDEKAEQTTNLESARARLA